MATTILTESLLSVEATQPLLCSNIPPYHNSNICCGIRSTFMHLYLLFLINESHVVDHLNIASTTTAGYVKRVGCSLRP